MATTALQRSGLPGLSISAGSSDRSLDLATTGWTHRRPKAPVTNATRFRIGSVSKALTSAALGSLVQEGALTLDDPVVRHIPEYPSEGVMTVRHLATHTSGIPHYRGRDFLNRRHYPSLTEAIAKFENRPLLFPPGTGFTYSSFGWNLLGLVLERAAGVPFLELMRSRVFDPWELTQTTAELGVIEGQARPYVRLGRLLLPAPRVDGSDSWPSAGFVSTTEDLVRFALAMLNGQLLSHNTVELLWKEAETQAGEKTGYGMGWQWTSLAGHRAVGHGGAHVGATAGLWIIPERRWAVALATNTNAPPGSLNELATEVVREELGGGR